MFLSFLLPNMASFFLKYQISVSLSIKKGS